jgi:hypothetical protein
MSVADPHKWILLPVQEPWPSIICHEPNSGVAAYQAGIDCVSTNGIAEIVLVTFCSSDDMERMLENTLDHRAHDMLHNNVLRANGRDARRLQRQPFM